MLAPSLAVRDYWERGKIGRVTVKGIEVKRPVYICSRKRDKEITITINRFIEYVKNRNEAKMEYE